MNYSVLNHCDTANGPGVRVSLFVSGCTNRCRGCFSPQTWDFDYGQIFKHEQMLELIKFSEPDYVRGLSILGGEPMHPNNCSEVRHIVEEYRNHFGGRKDVWVWTGYELDHLIHPLDDKTKFYEAGYSDYPFSDDSYVLVHDLVDVFVTGRFEEDKKDITLPYRGSSNQSVIHMNRTAESDGTVKVFPSIEERRQ